MGWRDFINSVLPVREGSKVRQGRSGGLVFDRKSGRYVSKECYQRRIPYRSSNLVNDFFREVIHPIKRDFGGVADVDYDSRSYRRGNNGFLKWLDDLDRPGEFNISGYRDMYGNEFLRRSRLTESTDVHETLHNFQSAPGIEPNIKGLSQDNIRLLGDAYGSGSTDSDVAEQHATNGEYQFRLYSDLAGKMGRSPTYDEYVRFVRGMGADQIIKTYGDPVNGYKWKDVKEIDPEKMRRAWLEVARSGSSGGRKTVA